MARRRRTGGMVASEPTATAKASAYDVERGESRLAPDNEDSLFFRSHNALEPPYDPRSMVVMCDRSHALRPNIDVYATNIDGFGHRLEPAIDLEDDSANDLIRTSLLVEALFDGDEVPRVTDQQVDARREEIQQVMRFERLQLELFFTQPAGDLSFIEMRERTRVDLELTGNGYWEIVRDQRGQISQVVHASAVSMRMKPLDPLAVETKVSRRISAVSFRRVDMVRRFRTFVQKVSGQEVRHFKEFGDPRIMSSLTGTFYASEGAALRREPGFVQATEVVHHKLYSPISVYGVPRWIGATPAVLGSRAAAEVNLMYFDNKAVPPMAILVSGGSLASGAVERIKNYLRDNIKGRQNFHSVLVLEAEGRASIAGQTPPRVRIEIKPLMEAMQQDALFQNYDERNGDKIGGMFRLPKLLRGDVKDFNRATADSALRYSEQQIFQPERVKIDFMINNRLFADMGIRFWKFVSNSPIAKDPAEQAKMLRDLEAYLTPEEGREIAGPLFGKELKRLTETWTQFPPDLFLAMLQQGFGLPEGVSDPGGIADLTGEQDLAKRLMAMRQTMEAKADEQARAELDAARDKQAKSITIDVPAAEFDSWVELAAHKDR